MPPTLVHLQRSTGWFGVVITMFYNSMFLQVIAKGFAAANEAY